VLDDIVLPKPRRIAVWFDEGLTAGANWRDQLASTVDESPGLPVAKKKSTTRYIEANPHISIHCFTYMIILDRLADQLYQRVISTVDAGLQQVAHVLRACWKDDSDRVVEFSEGVDEAVTPFLFRGLCPLATDMDLAMGHFRESFRVKEPFVVAMRIWIPSNVKPEDWQHLLLRADMKQLLDEAVVGVEWQNALRNRALASVTGISVKEGEFIELP